MLPAHFSLTVISLTFTEYTGHTHSHGHKHTQVTLFTARQLYQWSLPRGRQPVWLTASNTLRQYLPQGRSPIPTHQCHYSSTCIQSCTCFSSSHIFCWMVCFSCSTQWHVPFFCFFCEFGCWCHTEKNKYKKRNKKYVSKLWRMGVWGWAQH